MSRLGLTPSQTVGPYFHIALPWTEGPYVVPANTSGAVWLRGRVHDGEGNAVPDALVETWQADPDGRFDGEFRAFGRCATGPEGEWAIRTFKPGSLPTADGAVEAPHVDVSVFARGLLDRVVTRIYFADESSANDSDPVLRSVPERRRGTLVAAVTDDGYRFDIRLQGEQETVFFEL